MHITVFSRSNALYSTRRLVEAGREQGHLTEVVDHGLCVPVIKQNRPVLLFNGRRLTPPDVAIPRIGANLTQRGASIIRHLDLLGISHTMDATALVVARDKMTCLQALALEGLPMPETTLCFSIFDVRQAASRMNKFPLIVKLLESTHGIGVLLAHNMFELQRIAEGFFRFQDRIIIQEFIAESRGRDIRAFVVGDKVVAAMERIAEGNEFRANLHQGGRANAIQLSDEYEKIVLEAARVIGVEVAGVDLLESLQGPLIMEINASPGLEGIEGATGVDVAGAIIQYATAKNEKS